MSQHRRRHRQWARDGEKVKALLWDAAQAFQPRRPDLHDDLVAEGIFGAWFVTSLEVAMAEDPIARQVQAGRKAMRRWLKRTRAQRRVVYLDARSSAWDTFRRRLGGVLLLAGALHLGATRAQAQARVGGFFADSSLVVTPAEHEGGVPIYVLAAWGHDVPALSPAHLLGVIQRAVATRRGATTSAVAGRSVPGAVKNFTRIDITVEPEGVALRSYESCLTPEGYGPSVHLIRERITWDPAAEADVQAAMDATMSDAAGPHCGPQRASTGTPYTPSEPAMPKGGTGTVPGASLVLVQRAPERATDGDVDSIVVSPAIVRLRVGESRSRDSLFTVVGYRGGAPVPFASWVAVRNQKVARLWNQRLDGLRAGRTEIEVGVMLREPGREAPRMGKPKARVTVEVEP